MYEYTQYSTSGSRPTACDRRCSGSWSWAGQVDIIFFHNNLVISLCYIICRAGNSLIGFPSESLVFCPKMSEWAIHSFANFWWATWGIRSRSLISSERCERIIHGRSFFVRDLSDLLTWLIFGERPAQFTQIAQQKRVNERFAHFLN